jgi:hypothetical protein
MSSQEVSAWSGVLNNLPKLLGALRSDLSAPVLVALCNFLVALLKTKWFQNKLMALSRGRDEVELTDAGQTFLALFVGVLIAWFLSPASTEVRTIGRGLGIGFAAIGMYHAWRHTLRRVIFKDIKHPEEGEGLVYKTVKKEEPLEDPEEPEDDS